MRAEIVATNVVASRPPNGDRLQRRHSCQNLPAIKKGLENFPFKQIIFNWNSLNLELKATADPTEFDYMLKQNFISRYKYETDCPHNCFSCNGI